MEQRKPRGSLISTGTTSLVLIFVLLCLLTFSVLSLVSAQANLRLSRKSAQRTSDYYAAENAANDVLIRLCAAMDRASGAGEEAFYAAVSQAAADVEGLVFSDSRHLSYQVPLGEDQALSVALTLCYEPLPDGRHYRVDSWQTVSRYDWEAEEPLDVLTPENMPTGLD